MRISHEEKVDFDDVLIIPQRSGTPSRSCVELTRTFKFAHTDYQWTGVPIIAANMYGTGTFAMAKVLAKHQMLCALHKHYSIDDLVNFFQTHPHLTDYVFYSLGTSQEDRSKMAEVFHRLSEKGFPQPNLINLDVANGYTESFVDSVKSLRREYPNAVIMAGNVVTPNMTEELLLSGASIVKAGIGGGSHCMTRKKTGVGYPQLSCVDECSFAAHGLPHGMICSDGGCRNAGDVCKAICAGGDFVMLGGMLAGTDECEGEWTYEREIVDSTTYAGVPAFTSNEVKSSLKFFGMSSREAQEQFNGGLAIYRASEGSCTQIPYKGPVEEILKDIMGGLRSCGTMIGAEQIKNFPRCASFVRIAR